jgi:DNA-binding NarL/FixJ family response regulator
MGGLGLISEVVTDRALTVHVLELAELPVEELEVDGVSTAATGRSVRELVEAGSDDALAVLVTCDSFRAEEADAVRQLRTRMPNLAVVVVCQDTNARRVRNALRAGVDGFVYASEVAEALGPSLRAILAGQLAVPRDFRAHVAKPMLTTREKQILALVILGLSNGEISRKLYLAESTVKSHLSSAFAKLGVRSRNEAAALILDPSGGLGPGILRISDEPGRGGDGEDTDL